jgi:subtilisin-like proprotein convertase family protein
VVQRIGPLARFVLIPVLFSLFIVPFPDLAFEPRPEETPLQKKRYFKDELRISTTNERIDLPALRQQAGDAPLQRFIDEHGSDFIIYRDPRSGALSSLIGRVPMVPGSGTGNGKTLDELQRDLGRPVAEVEMTVVRDLVRNFIVENGGVIGIDVSQLGPTRARPVGGHLWQISIPQEVGGIPVRHGRIAATINHGNLVLLGTETWGDVTIDTRPIITGEQALEIGFAYVDGKDWRDELWKKPALEIVPYAPPEHQTEEAFTGPVGKGYGHRLVWAVGFRRPPGIERWEILVDAHTAEVISFEDTNMYASEQMVGGVYPLTDTEVCPTDDTCGTMQSDYPMPFADTGQAAPNDLTNSAGLYEYDGGTATTTLDGPYVRVNDNCGAVNESTTEGPLNLGGVNGDHDCTTAGTSAGNTASARTCFYELNKLMEMARGWLPANTWLQSTLQANVNITDTCNANYDYTNVNFFKSGGGCRNTGEIAAVFDHEWGHAMDDNDAGGSMSSSSEAYADIAAIYRLHASCVGHGFWHTYDNGCGQTSDGTGFNGNESRTGTHCDLDCSGVRDADWDKHEDHTPDTPQNFLCVHCDSGSGPCGKQVHCSAAPSRQAAWDFVARDLQAPPFNYDENTAFILGNKLFYQGSGNVGSWHACTCPDTSNGCGATNAYMQWLAADDDNGDLNDGTPHMTALHAAFARHNIACDTPAPVDSGCAGGPTEPPLLSAEIGSNELTLSWDTVPGALQYRVFRTEGHAGCDFGKALIATVSDTSYVDPDVANGRPYYYVVQAVGTSQACFGVASECVEATPQPCAGSIRLDRKVYNCSDALGITLVDADLIGAGTYDVTVSSQSEPVPETATLVESPPGSGVFSGTFSTTSAPAVNGDGMLTVSNGDTITAQYLDVSYCGTPDVNVERTAPVDCAAPAISNVRAVNVTGHSADIAWDTDEPADGGVTYDLAVPPTTFEAFDAEAVTNHQIHLLGLDECSTYYYFVRSTDLAANPVADDNAGAYYTFETGKNVNPTYPTLDPPVPIPDSDPVGATSTIVVADDEPIQDVNVIVNITHTYDGDLEVSLIGPDDTTVILSNRRGSSGNDFIDTVFDDEASEAIANGSAPFTGSFQPDEPLSAFDGKLAAGTWKLRVEDMAGSDLGTIDSWSLEFSYPPQACGPHLKYQSHAFSDQCGGVGAGGGNELVEVGEDVVLPVTLRNNGTDPTTGITARLTTSTAGVTVTRATAGYTDLAAGASAESLTDPFAFTVGTSVACGTTIDFEVEATANQGTWTDQFSLRVGTSGFATTTVDSTDVPHPITDNTTITSTIEISDTYPVADVNVGLTLTHTYDGDLDIFLIGPNGMRVELSTDNGSSGDNFTDTIFDDEAATAIGFGTAPFTGSFQPEGSLASLDGILPTGTWALEITDDAGGDLGELVAWSVILTSDTGPQCESCSVAAPVLATSLNWVAESETDLEWTLTSDASFYNLYRGTGADLTSLIDGAADSCRRLTTMSTTTGGGLTEPPPPGSLFWYLVRGGSAGGEGPVGDASSGPRLQDSTGDCP